MLPEKSSEVFEIISERCKHDYWLERQSAMECMKDIVISFLEKITEAFEIFVERYNDDDELRVQETALLCIVDLVKWFPEKNAEVFEILTAACKDKHPFMRETAMKCITDATKFFPEKALDSFAILVGQFQNEDESDVRKEGMRCISDIVKILPEKVPKAFEIFAEGCKDGYINVQETAMRCVSDLVHSFPVIATEAFKIFGEKCEDDNHDIRQSAIAHMVQLCSMSDQCIPLVLSFATNRISSLRQSDRMLAEEPLTKMTIADVVELFLGQNDDSDAFLSSIAFFLMKNALCVFQPIKGIYRVVFFSELDEKEWNVPEQKIQSLVSTLHSEVCQSFPFLSAYLNPTKFDESVIRTSV